MYKFLNNKSFYLETLELYQSSVLGQKHYSHSCHLKKNLEAWKLAKKGLFLPHLIGLCFFFIFSLTSNKFLKQQLGI